MRKMSEINIVVGVDESGGFGKEGKIPWNIPEDLKHFQKVTKDSICIMGRRTYEDMVEMRGDKEIKKSILPGRECYVLSRDKKAVFKGAIAKTGIREAVESLKPKDKRTIFVIGGDKLFVEAFSWASKVYLTVVEGHHGCDRFFQVDYLNQKFHIDFAEKKGKLTFVEYIRS